MKVAILCGGRGTRIREVSDVVPKPMVPVGHRPILWHIMKIYSAYGFNEFVLLLGHKGNYIREFFLNFAAYTTDVTVDLSSTRADHLVFHGQTAEPWQVTLVDTGEEAMTGARLWRARRYLEPEGTFCATYGDGVGNVNVAQLVRFHQGHGKVATLTGVHPPGRFGELVVKGSAVCKFNEKPPFSGTYLNGGFFIFNADVFDRYLNDREDLVLEREPLEQLAADNQLMMYQHDGFWHHMDTPAEFEVLNKIWKAGNAPWKVWS